MWYLVIIGIIIVSIVVAIYFTKPKLRRALKILLGFILMLSALPIAFAIELELNGCCGAPQTGYKNVGYFLGAVTFIIGLTVAIVSIHRTKP